MKKQLVIDEDNGVVTACVLEDGELVERLSGSADKPQLCGNIYLGRVQNTLPAMNSAFIDIGLDKNAILSGEDLIKANNAFGKIKPGIELPVQITKLPGEGKGVVVSADIKLAGRLCVLMPLGGEAYVSKKIDDQKESARLKELAKCLRPANMGLILRTNASGESDNEIIGDIKRTEAEWENIKTKSMHLKAPALLYDESSILYKAARDIFNDEFEEVVFSSEILYNTFSEHIKEIAPLLLDRIRLIKTDNLFSVYRIREQAEKALKRKIWLKSGAWIVIDKTEALTAIDVNSGKFTSGADERNSILSVNIDAAKEIAKQIRLRDIGGIIIVDFIDMKLKEDKAALVDYMRNCLTNDKNRTIIIDITPLGLMELTRKRKHETSYYGEK